MRRGLSWLFVLTTLGMFAWLLPLWLEGLPAWLARQQGFELRYAGFHADPAGGQYVLEQPEVLRHGQTAFRAARLSVRWQLSGLLSQEVRIQEFLAEGAEADWRLWQDFQPQAGPARLHVQVDLARLTQGVLHHAPRAPDGRWQLRHLELRGLDSARPDAAVLLLAVLAQDGAEAALSARAIPATGGMEGRLALKGLPLVWLNPWLPAGRGRAQAGTVDALLDVRWEELTAVSRQARFSTVSPLHLKGVEAAGACWQLRLPALQFSGEASAAGSGRLKGDVVVSGILKNLGCAGVPAATWRAQGHLLVEQQPGVPAPSVSYGGHLHAHGLAGDWPALRIEQGDVQARGEMRLLPQPDGPPWLHVWGRMEGGVHAMFRREQQDWLRLRAADLSVGGNLHVTPGAETALLLHGDFSAAPARLDWMGLSAPLVLQAQRFVADDLLYLRGAARSFSLQQIVAETFQISTAEAEAGRLQARRVRLPALQWRTHEPLRIGQASASGLEAEFERRGGQGLRLVPFAARSPGDVTRPLALAIERVQLEEGGHLWLSDPDSGLRLPLELRSFRLDGLDFTQPESLAVYTLSAAAKPAGQVELSGSLRPGADWRLQLQLRGMNFEALNSWVVARLGYSLKGYYDVDAGVEVAADGGLSGAAHLFTSQLQAEARHEQAALTDERIGLSLPTAIQLLADDDGDISLELPISGSLAAPQLDYGDAVSQALSTSVKTGVMLIWQPLGLVALTGKLAGRLFSADLDAVPFVPGSSALPARQQGRLHQLAVTMEERRLRLRVCGVAFTHEPSALAAERAQMVEHMLLSSGVPPDRLADCEPRQQPPDERGPRVELQLEPLPD
jgi:hypothetical protein